MTMSSDDVGFEISALLEHLRQSPEHFIDRQELMERLQVWCEALAGCDKGRRDGTTAVTCQRAVPVTALELTVRATNGLLAGGIETVGDAVDAWLPGSDGVRLIYRLDNIGRKAREEMAEPLLKVAPGAVAAVPGVLRELLRIAPDEVRARWLKERQGVEMGGEDG